MKDKRPGKPLENKLIDNALKALKESNLKAELKRNGKERRDG